MGCVVRVLTVEDGHTVSTELTDEQVEERFRELRAEGRPVYEKTIQSTWERVGKHNPAAVDLLATMPLAGG